MNARRLARAFMVLGLAALIAAFTVKAGADVRVGMMLAGVAVVELGGLLAIRTRGPIEGFRRTTPRYAFLAAVLIASGYIGTTLGGNPMVGAAIGLVSPLKLVAVLAALIAGFFEESLFRGVLMDRLAAAGRSPILQVLISGLVFGPSRTMEQDPALAGSRATASLLLSVVVAVCQWPIVCAHGRPAEMPAGGHENCPLMATRSAHQVFGGVGHVGVWV